ncbi:hypothetical protein Tco_1547379 [Tanacetum coccineum]
MIEVGSLRPIWCVVILMMMLFEYELPSILGVSQYGTLVLSTSGLSLSLRGSNLVPRICGSSFLGARTYCKVSCKIISSAFSTFWYWNGGVKRVGDKGARCDFISSVIIQIVMIHVSRRIEISGKLARYVITNDDLWKSWIRKDEELDD